MVAQAIQYLISFTIHVNAAATFLVICRILGAFCADFGQQLDNFDQEIGKFNTKEYSQSEMRVHLKVRLQQQIQFHCDIKRS